MDMQWWGQKQPSAWCKSDEGAISFRADAGGESIWLCICVMEAGATDGGRAEAGCWVRFVGWASDVDRLVVLESGKDVVLLRK